MSDAWVNEDDDNYLIIRLLYPNDGYPWLVAHHGIHEAFKAPLYVPIIDTKGKDSCIALILRDFANRDRETGGPKHCIVRKFILRFGSNAEADEFRLLHNSMLLEYK